ncbi:hypothetical protein AGMMS50218_08950 [Actinomycetota bacterium]|nr:hypothetical protein AGMMS50218_08950 [Actinomycetota bacterium]
MFAERTTQRDVRRRNRTVVMSRLYFGGPTSRRELSAATGLSSGAVTGLVGELLEEGIVEETGSVSSDGGRPRVIVQVATGRRLVAGVDIGEDRIRVGLFTLGLELVEQHSEFLASDELVPQIVVRRVHDVLAALLEKHGVAWDRVLGVGIGMLGIVEQGRSAIVHVPTVGWHAVPIEAMLREQIPVPVFIDNGARVLGQVEMWFGAGRGARSAAVVLYGTGIGAALVTQAGVSVEPGFATEWGHTILMVDGRPCRCGSRGCLEAYVGAATLVERYQEVAPDRVPPGTNIERAFTILMADVDSSELAYRLVASAAHRLGASLGGMLNALRPERILVGGYAGALLGREMLPIIRESAAATALAPWAVDVDVQLCSFGADGVMTGAATQPIGRWLEIGAPVHDLRELGSAHTG